MMSDYPPAELHPEAVVWMLHQLDPSEVSDFYEGLSKMAHRLDVDPGRETAQDFVRFLRSWFVTVSLRSNEEWQGQVAATTATDPEEPADASTLRRLLGV